MSDLHGEKVPQVSDEDAAEGYDGPWWVRLYIEHKHHVPAQPGTLGHTYVSVGPNKAMEAWTCERCGALVTDTTVHDASHSGRTSTAPNGRTGAGQ